MVVRWLISEFSLVDLLVELKCLTCIFLSYHACFGLVDGWLNRWLNCWLLVGWGLGCLLVEYRVIGWLLIDKNRNFL